MNGWKVDPVNDIKEWYNQLYRGEKLLVKIAAVLIIIMMAFWVTHEPKERYGVPKPILLNGR